VTIPFGSTGDDTPDDLRAELDRWEQASDEDWRRFESAANQDDMLHDIPLWQKLVIVFAVLLMLGGVGYLYGKFHCTPRVGGQAEQEAKP